MQIDYTASRHVREVIGDLGRTEDIKFSPSNRRLAIAGFLKNKITVFDVLIDSSPDLTTIHLTDAAVISSTYLKRPHGLDFLDEETIVVANREGIVTILKLPSGGLGGNCYELAPLETIPGDVVETPGSVSVTRKDRNLYEALICNNYRHHVTRHFLDFSTGCSIKNDGVLLSKGIEIPDGVCISNDKHWIAVSNHIAQNVFLYEYTSSLNEFSDPDGILRCVYYPHGLRFTSDGRFILVADAGDPYVHIYAKNGSSWRGVQNPIISLKVMSDEDFLRGRYNAQEGGPKGIDVDNTMKMFVITCEVQPLAFFDLKSIIEKVWVSRFLQIDPIIQLHNTEEENENCRHDQRALEMKFELETGLRLTQGARAEAEVAAVKNSRAWRMTAPVRRIAEKFRTKFARLQQH